MEREQLIRELELVKRRIDKLLSELRGEKVGRWGFGEVIGVKEPQGVYKRVEVEVWEWERGELPTGRWCLAVAPEKVEPPSGASIMLRVGGLPTKLCEREGVLHEWYPY